jgi:methylmalonyl-CoA/ethylmalonyl-CoA epimerase
VVALKSLCRLGDIMQMAYVPFDYAAALKFWTQKMGAGPFFEANHIKLQNVKYLGQPIDLDFSLAIGYWGDIQIELVRQHNDVPSIFSTWLRNGHEGVHHACILVDSLDEARKHCAEHDMTIAQEGTVRSGGEVIYIDTGGGPGSMVEVLARGPGTDAYFAMMKKAAREWDGSNPVRLPA